MSTNLINTINSYVSQDIITNAASFFGEKEDSISKAVTALIPTILGGVINKGTESEIKSQQILEAAKEANNSGVLEKVGSLFGNTAMLTKGTDYFNEIFSGQSNTIVNSVSDFAAVTTTSSGSLTAAITLLIMAVLGKHAAENNLNTNGFSNFLLSQKSHVLNAIPSKLGPLAAALGLGSVNSDAREIVDNMKESTTYDDSSNKKTIGGMKWLLPLLLLAAVAFLLWWVMGKGCCNSCKAPTGADTIATAPADSLANTRHTAIAGVLDTVSGNYIYDVGANKEIKLADGTTITVGENSTEAKLYNMLNDASFIVDTIDKTANWIVLDRVYFETGQSILTKESATQVKNLAAILKNFPNASIKLGGYTDNTGNAAINKEISLQRAQAVAKKLVDAGVAEKMIVETEGYGPDFPVCPANDTPECKAQNRRVDLKVAAK